MKYYFVICFILLCTSSTSSSPMNYVYYENPDLGYVASLSGPSAFTKTRFNGPKKFFVGNTNQKYMKLANDEAINSLFSIGKLSQNMYNPVIDTGNINTPNDKNWQYKEPVLNNKDIKFVEVEPSKSKDTYHTDKYRVTPDASIHETPHQEKQPIHPKNYFEHRATQNKRRANVKIVPKIQHDVNLPPIKQSQHPIPQFAEKLSKSAREMTYKQSEKKNNVEALTTILNGMTQEALDRYKQKQENKKRETQTAATEHLQSLISHPFSKNSRVKFLDSKHIPARIGKSEEYFNNRPYALFYRGLDNHDHRDFYTGSVDNSLHNNVMESKSVVKDVFVEREKRKAIKVMNMQFNKETKHLLREKN